MLVALLWPGPNPEKHRNGVVLEGRGRPGWLINGLCQEALAWRGELGEPAAWLTATPAASVLTIGKEWRSCGGGCLQRSAGRPGVHQRESRQTGKAISL